ncbi:hypothetical protein GH714_025751 [Hevea brasiliensis]|uniref:Phosphatidylinositol-glycan biosynthesis class F protein n=1 Tax=Hevea brasiliensis TaxID=3981 RepID=A0A6A6LJC7_HEVBR|nr:hypothetical protein GH714_025751 [Hevea brasiliensis]
MLEPSGREPAVQNHGTEPTHGGRDEGKEKKQKKSSIAKASNAENSSQSLSALQVFSIHMICGLGLAIALWMAHNLYSINVISDPSCTLRLIWVSLSLSLDFVVLFFLYEFVCSPSSDCRESNRHTSLQLVSTQSSTVLVLESCGRGILALPVGALVNALGAIVLGAPVGIEYLPKTINWSLLMSSFMFVPAASVFGSSSSHWQRIFAHTKPNESLEYMICIPAHGALIGAWFGAWPMPLDWERPWQDWPICVTYGAITGYLVAMVVSLGFALVHGGRQHLKRD